MANLVQHYRPRRWLVLLALACGGTPFLVAVEKDVPAAKKDLLTLTGKVVPLSTLLEKYDVKLDADAAPAWYALVTDDHKVYPLIKDHGARLFFKDARLLNRPMRLTGRLYPGSQLLQVFEVQSLVNGKPHEVYYWCDVCTIKRFEKMICECCGGPMELRETPVKD